LAVAVVLVGLIIPVAASALTPLSRGYATDEKIPVGSVVSLVNNSSDQVVAATTENVEGLLGVVVNADSSLLSVKNGRGSQVQVTTGGTEPVLVSDINGDILRGDHITASPIKGVGMKATANIRIIGVAQADLTNGKKQTYKDESGVEQSVVIGEVPVVVNISSYFKEPVKTIVPLAIQNIANSLAGRQVNTLPILISAAIFIITIVVVVSIIYSMIRSSIISVGRNPMSQSAIYRDLIQLSALVLVILGVGISSIYMIITKV
jgi:hypothetical protein